jgi:hypothetical protein
MAEILHLITFIYFKIKIYDKRQLLWTLSTPGSVFLFLFYLPQQRHVEIAILSLIDYSSKYILLLFFFFLHKDLYCKKSRLHKTSGSK